MSQQDDYPGKQLLRDEVGNRPVVGARLTNAENHKLLPCAQSTTN